MRRRDRQITDPGQIETILNSAVCCRLGLVEDGLAYIVPMNFGVARENGNLCLYFHSSPKGRKIELIEQTGRASFEVDVNCEIKSGDKACEFSCYYQSVVGHGKASILRGDEEKLRALRCVMAHYTGNEDWEILPQMLPVVVGIRLEIEEVSAKAYQPRKA